MKSLLVVNTSSTYHAISPFIWRGVSGHLGNVLSSFWFCVCGFLFNFEILRSCVACSFSCTLIMWFSLMFSCRPDQSVFLPHLLCLFSSFQCLQLFQLFPPSTLFLVVLHSFSSTVLIHLTPPTYHHLVTCVCMHSVCSVLSLAVLYPPSIHCAAQPWLRGPHCIFKWSNTV